MTITAHTDIPRTAAPAPRRPDHDLSGVRVLVADGLVMLVLSGEIGVDQIARVVTELDAVCRMRSGAVAVICTDDTRISPAAVVALGRARQRHLPQADRIRLFGGNDATTDALLRGGLPHHGAWNDHQLAALRGNVH